MTYIFSSNSQFRVHKSCSADIICLPVAVISSEILSFAVQRTSLFVGRLLQFNNLQRLSSLEIMMHGETNSRQACKSCQLMCTTPTHLHVCPHNMPQAILKLNTKGFCKPSIICESDTSTSSLLYLFGWCRSCLTDWRRKLSSLPAASDSLYSGVEQQLDILGADHVGYAHKRFTSSSGAPFAIVGARPFSKVSTVIAQTDVSSTELDG